MRYKKIRAIEKKNISLVLIVRVQTQVFRSLCTWAVASKRVGDARHRLLALICIRKISAYIENSLDEYVLTEIG